MAQRPTLQSAETAGAKLNVKVEAVSVLTVADFDGAFAMMARDGVGAVLVHASSLTARHNPALLAEVALKHRLPTMFNITSDVESGGLMAYAPDTVDMTRRSAIYIDKILKGAKPADLPVEQASKFQLVINLKTANALGLTIPPSILTRADEVIE
jgi:putative ABC transport system substrate-binding protein